MGANRKATEAELVDGLCCIGYEVLEAELLVVFVPLGLARAIIRRLPQPEPVELSDHAIVVRDGRELVIPFKLVPEFVEAERLGEETFLTGTIAKEDLTAAAQISVELNLINKMLFDDVTTSGAYIAPPILLGLPEAPGFEDWYSEIKARSKTNRRYFWWWRSKSNR